jgi:arginase
LQALEWNVKDLPDLDFSNWSENNIDNDESETMETYFTDNNLKAKNCRQVGRGAQLVCDRVYESLQRGEFPLTLGGDHSIGLGTLSGVLKHQPNTGIIWVDAHADLNTPYTSESGNMHGMPVGMLMQHVTTPNIHTLPNMGWLENSPRLDPSQVVYIGLRDVDFEERKLIQKLDICAYTMHEIDRYGIGHVMEMAFHHLLERTPNRPLHVSYDIDAVDPVLAPATGTTVRGGLTFREAHFVAEAVALTGNLASADIVEVNPSLSHTQGATETVELGIQIITSLMGKSII